MRRAIGSVTSERSARGALAAALLLVAATAGAGCDPGAFLLDVGLLPGAREAAVDDCCACLAGGAPPDVPGARCPLADGGEASVTCLCEASAEACVTSLLANDAITLVGACVREDGRCEGACGDVLAYPGVDDEG